MTEPLETAPRAVQSWQQIITRALLFSLASNTAVLFVIEFGLYLWPEGLSVNSQNIFWLATGINTGGLLLLGLRYWPVLLLNAFPAWLLGGDPFEMNFLGASTNALEALLAAWLIQKAGGFTGRFDSIRSVGALLIASLVAPLVNTLIIPAYLCAKGAYPWAEYGRALGNWNLSNGTAMLFLAPLVVAIFRSDWSPGRRTGERICAGVAVGALSVIGFDATLHGVGMNLAFLAFPAIIYTAVRFGIGETSVALGLTLVAVYVSLALHAPIKPTAEVPAMIWFLQAFCWVLAATGLLVAALGTERRRAENSSLEASLTAEKARLAALRYQINPHFLFNALNSVRATLPLSESVAREMITDLAGYLRSTLDGDEDDRVVLSEEIKSLQEYLRIEQRRFGERLQTEFSIEEAAASVEVPTFLLQPLIENAIRHGLEASREPCLITVKGQCREGKLLLEICNSGIWRANGSRQGVGLANIRKRLELLYGSEADFRIKKEENPVRVVISFPIRKRAQIKSAR